MVDVILKSDPKRPGWYHAAEISRVGVGFTSIGRLAPRAHTWRPPTDVYEVESAVVVRVEIAGMRETDFAISIQERTLTIRGVRLDIPERRAYYQMEVMFGEFASEVELPFPVVVEQAQAEYRSGFLTIILPKMQPRQVPITDL
jgi:HSP20 family protein